MKNANVECHDTDVLTMKKKLALKKTVKSNLNTIAMRTNNGEYILMQRDQRYSVVSRFYGNIFDNVKMHKAKIYSDDPKSDTMSVLFRKFPFFNFRLAKV